MLQTPAPTPAAPAPPALPGAPGGGPPTANQMLEAARAFRRELTNQLERAEERREELQDQLNVNTREGETPLSPVDRAGIEARLKETDARISALDAQITQADLQVANAASVPGATDEPPRPPVVRDGPPEEAWFLGGMFIFLVMMPIAIAQARRLWRKPTATTTEMPAELTDRLNRLEQAVDAVAVELERVGEGQRYVTRVFTEGNKALGSPAAEPIEVRQREAIHQSRP